MGRNQITGCQKLRWGEGLTTKEQERTELLYHDCDGDYSVICICQNSPNCTLKMVVLFWM